MDGAISAVDRFVVQLAEDVVAELVGNRTEKGLSVVAPYPELVAPDLAEIAVSDFSEVGDPFLGMFADFIRELLLRVVAYLQVDPVFAVRIGDRAIPVELLQLIDLILDHVEGEVLLAVAVD